MQRQEWKKYLSLPVRAGHIEHEMKEQLLNNGIWCYEINLYFDEDLDENTLDYFAYRNDVIRKGKKSRHFYAKMKDNKTFTECYWEVD